MRDRFAAVDQLLLILFLPSNVFLWFDDVRRGARRGSFLEGCACVGALVVWVAVLCAALWWIDSLGFGDWLLRHAPWTVTVR